MNKQLKWLIMDVGCTIVSFLTFMLSFFIGGPEALRLMVLGVICFCCGLPYSLMKSRNTNEVRRETDG